MFRRQQRLRSDVNNRPDRLFADQFARDALSVAVTDEATSIKTVLK
jgi:hypothetical protein